MYSVRPASRADAPGIRRIYNHGIDSHQATFETDHRTLADIEKWFTDALVIQGAYSTDDLVAFALVTRYRDRKCYSGVGEFSIYVDSAHRGLGVGRLLLAGLMERARDSGYWKLLSRVFPENRRCRRLLRHMGFREVGVYRKHARLCGAWRDVVIVERLLNETGAPPEPASGPGRP
jgi:L-amino acid N-acyltransferase YncA